MGKTYYDLRLTGTQVDTILNVLELEELGEEKCPSDPEEHEKYLAEIRDAYRAVEDQTRSKEK